MSQTDEQRVEQLARNATLAMAANRQDTVQAIAEANRAFDRAIRRTRVAQGYEQVKLPCAHGPTIEFAGRLLAETEVRVKDRGEPLKIRFEIWETPAGAMVAATYTSRADGPEEEIEARVIEPDEDSQAMRFAVMAAFDWSIRARSMVRKLGWSLRLDAD